MTKTPHSNKLPKKRNRQGYFSQRYQAKKEWYQDWYLARKQQKDQKDHQTLNTLYQAQNIKILMSLKDYTEFNLDKRKIWLDFAWTLKDCQQEGISSIEEVMKLRETAENLINDYRTTAINETRQGKNWAKLSQKKRDQLIKYWAQEKARKDQELSKQLTQLATQGDVYYQELEIAKFHEERGKINCVCWQCAKAKQLSEEFNEQLFSDGDNKDEEKPKLVKSECAGCCEYKKVDSETGFCAKCGKD